MNGQSDKKKTAELSLVKDGETRSSASSSADQTDDNRQDAASAGNGCENGVCAVTWKPQRPAA